MWAGIVEGGGLRMQGIFRIAPDPGAALAAERQLAKGLLSSSVTPDVLAHLIKSFYRRLPGSGLLGAVPRDLIDGCIDGPGYAALCTHLSPGERALLEWLVRVLCEVAQHKDTNMMGLRNLTLVLAPNLLVQTGQDGSPPKQKGYARGIMMRAGGLTKRGSGSPKHVVCNPVEELLNIEMVSNALYTLAVSSMRFTL